MDLRRLAVKDGLNQLTTNQINRLIEKIRLDPDSVLCDNGWNDPDTGRWCAKAQALDVPSLGIVCETNEKARELIQKVGEANSLAGKEFSLNTTSGISGNFYTTNRLEDLAEICEEIINERTRGVT